MIYARTEYERRFLLAALPVPEDALHRVITDLYLPELRLRLRCIVASDGSSTEYKLGQKHRLPGAPADERAMTTFYLTAEEYGFLASRFAADARRLVKRRYPFWHGGIPYSIDFFESGLILADLELDDPPQLRALPVPPFAIREVTADAAYEGGSLATAAPRRS